MKASNIEEIHKLYGSLQYLQNIEDHLLNNNKFSVELSLKDSLDNTIKKFNIEFTKTELIDFIATKIGEKSDKLTDFGIDF
jgi:hypothetical protein